MMIILKILLAVLFLFFALNVLYILVFAIAGRFRKNPVYVPAKKKNNIAVLIPAYQEDNVIFETARTACEHNYPHEHFDVYLIADDLRPDTIEKLSAIPRLKIMPVAFEKSTKGASMKYATLNLPDDHYDIVFILDADNILMKDGLEKLNAAYEKGFRMIQLHRCAKNFNTNTAILDAIAEEINNHVFRQGHRALGLSAALIGSGMGFDFNDFKEIMIKTDIEGNRKGEDREIFIEMLRKGYVCEYIEEARVLDEKVQSTAVLEKQRNRWISAQVKYSWDFWVKRFWDTITSGRHYISLALQQVVLPRVLLLFFLSIVSILGGILYLAAGIDIYPGTVYWVILLGAYLLALAISIYGRVPFSKILKASASLPVASFLIFRALLKAKYKKEEFVHMPKEYTGKP